MVDVAEHVYHDDPSIGHPDVRTRLGGVSYYFLGNGLIQGAVQHAPEGEGTPLGLLIMNPERLGKKRECLTMHPSLGLEPTVVRMATECGTFVPLPAHLKVAWVPDAPVPTVNATWIGDGIAVDERFSCPSLTAARLAREIRVHNVSDAHRAITIRLGTDDEPMERAIPLPPGAQDRIWVLYELAPGSNSVSVRFADRDPLEADVCAHWTNCSVAALGDPTLDAMFRASAAQLPAAVSARGRLDGSIWQYNREWVRDQAFIAQALTLLGRREIAATMLRRLLTEFVTADGATLDSSEVRGRDDVELDQNGVLLYVLSEFVAWTGDRSLVTDLWDRIAATADYPLRPEFRHAPSGMLSGSREFWERHAAHGIEPGLEMIYQMYVSMGLAGAAALAREFGTPQQAERWQSASEALRSAALTHPMFALHDARGFVKRRQLDGRLQETITARVDSGLPPGVPLACPRAHYLNPDTCAVLPIAFGLVDPVSPIATATLQSVEELWNQEWDDGGYGRYHVSSEPDSPGAWPFASLFVARASLEAGLSDRVWRILHWLSQTAGSPCSSWFEFNGPRLAPPFPQVGVIPWTWAEVVLLIIHHMLGVRPAADGIHVRPRLLKGLDRVTARVPVRKGWLRLDLTTTADAPPAQEFVVPYESGEMMLTARVRAIG